MINVVAVGVAMAAATSAVFRAMFSSSDSHIVWVTAPSTLLLGTLWAALLRRQKTWRNTSVRTGWLLSIPLAMSNAALAAGLLLVSDHGGGGSLAGFLGGMFMGATFGAMFWVPGLILTLLCFGLPIARAQRLAKQGLSGQERGEAIVGAASLVISLLALANAVTAAAPTSGLWLLRTLAATGAALGASAIGVAWLSDQRRKAFVADVEAGNVPQFRVDATHEGKVLVRVVSQGEGYRVADYAEEVAALDREGQVTRWSEGR